MRTFIIDVPFGLSITLRTKVPGRISISYRNRHRNSAESRGVSRSSKTIASMALGNAAHEPSEIEIDVPTVPVRVYQAMKSLRDATDKFPKPVAHSPVDRPDSRASQRTEPVYEDHWDLHEWMPIYTSYNIKIRDFAHEPFPNNQKAPVIFDPCIGLLNVERKVKVRAGEVRRLFDMGWLTEDEARGALPQAEMWDEILSRERRECEYPWIPLNIDRPSGTTEEVIDALRQHMRRTYPKQRDLVDEESHPGTTIAQGLLDGETSSSGTHPPIMQSGDEDVEMGDVSRDPMHAPAQAAAATAAKRQRTDGTSSTVHERGEGGGNEICNGHKRQRLTSDATITPTTTPNQSSSSGGSNINHPQTSPRPQIISDPSASRDPASSTASPHPRPKALARTETLHFWTKPS